MMTACTREKENNYLLWIFNIIKNYSFILYTNLKNIQIKVNIPFLYFAASNRWCRCFIVKHRPCSIFLGHFAVSTPTLFKVCRYFLDFTNVGPEWFLAKMRCAYCISLCNFVGDGIIIDREEMFAGATDTMSGV